MPPSGVVTPEVIIGTTITDNINGYTRQVLFEGLDNTIFPLDAYEQYLLDNLPSGNTINDLELLIDAYTP